MPFSGISETKRGKPREVFPFHLIFPSEFSGFLREVVRCPEIKKIPKFFFLFPCISCFSNSVEFLFEWKASTVFAFDLHA